MTGLSFLEVLTINIIMIGIVFCMYVLLKALRKLLHTEPRVLPKNIFDKVYDASYAVLKDLIRKKETFDSYSHLVDTVIEYYLNIALKDVFEDFDDETKLILIYGIITYIVKEHDMESKLIGKRVTSTEIVRDSQEEFIKDDIAFRFGGKVVAHTKNSEESTMEWDKYKSIGIDKPIMANIKYDESEIKKTIIDTIDKFYEE